MHAASGPWGDALAGMPVVCGGDAPGGVGNPPGSPAWTPLPAPQDLSRGSIPALARGREFFWHQLNNGDASVPTHLAREGSSVNNASSCSALRCSRGAGLTAGLRRGRQHFLRQQHASQAPVLGLPSGHPPAAQSPCTQPWLYFIWGEEKALSLPENWLRG